MLGEGSRFTVRQPRKNLERHKSLVMFRTVMMFLLTEESIPQKFPFAGRTMSKVTVLADLGCVDSHIIFLH